MFEPNVIYRIKLRCWKPLWGPVERNEEAFTYDNAVERAKGMVALVALDEEVKGIVCTIHRTVMDKSPAWQWPPAETAAPKETPSE